MVGMFGQKVSLAQAQGPDVELVVKGTELYATYETPEVFPPSMMKRAACFVTRASFAEDLNRQVFR